MLGLFRSDPYTDSELGTFVRSGGKWQGRISVPDIGEKPIALSGNRRQPDMGSLDLARQFPSQYRAVMPEIQKALFEHYEPYLQAHEAGKYRAGEAFPRLSNDPTLWQRVRLLGIAIETAGKVTTAEVAYETDWDDEHTVGALIRNGKLIELNGSI